MSALGILAARIGIVVLVLGMWEVLPRIEILRGISVVFDPFFVSAPSLIASKLWELCLGLNGQPLIWSFLGDTLKGTFIGVAIGTALGAASGLFLSNNPLTQKIVRPFVAVLNATPRIALVPIFVILCGPSTAASVLTVVAVVYFLVFYNAYAGGVSVPGATVQNAQLLGATGFEIMLRLRLPYVLVWTFTSLSNAISFGLVAAVTAEILTGQAGMGRLLLNSIANVDSTLTFSVVVVLSLVGVALVTAADSIEKRMLHWWHQSR